MRRSALALALLCTTALTPCEAQAAPVVAGVAAIAGAIGSAVSAVGGAVVGAFGAGGFFGTALGQIVLSVGLSAIATLLQPRPEVPKPSARMANFAQPVAYMERVYGRVRKGGPLGFTGFAGNSRVNLVILASHRIEGFVQHYLDERLVEVSGATVTTDPPGDHVGIEGRLGNIPQVAISSIVSAFPEWTNAHNMAGLAYAAVASSRPDPDDFSEIYPSGREPAYNPVIDGHARIYDPRTNTFGYTRNAALIIAHELTQYQGREVDWDEVAEEANVAEQAIVNVEGLTQNRWLLAGVISDDQEWEDIRAQMMAACDAWFYERTDGKIGFKLGRWIEPTVTLTAADFLSLEISEGQPMGAPTEFVVQYVEPRNRYREAPSGAWVHDPSARRVREEIAAYMVSNHNQAARVAKRIARNRRARYAVNGLLRMSGYNLIGQRFARLDHAELGLSFPIEIGKLAWNADRTTFQLEAVSTAEEDFAFDAALEEPIRPIYNATTSTDAVPNATGLTAEAVQSTGGAAAIRWTWPPQPAYVRQQLRYRRTIDAEWQYVTTTAPGQITVTTTGLLDGAEYEGQLRNRTGLGRVSEWKPDGATLIHAVANLTPPGALSNFAAEGGAGEAVVSFDAPNDAQYFATRIYRAAVLDFDSAELVRTEYGIPSNADSWTDESLSPGTYYYWGEPINSSGVAGTITSADSAIVT